MSLRHITSTPEYLCLLRSDEEELKALRKDLLVSVTSFVRDPQAWQVLADQLIRRSSRAGGSRDGLQTTLRAAMQKTICEEP